MKRSFIFLCVASMSVLAAQAAGCPSFDQNLTRGAENASVLSLQQFLAGKGYLSASPNGYFGPATFAAVKLYQKSVGLPQTGAVLSMTRAALLKESCAPTTKLPQMSSQQAVATSTATSSSSVSYPRPVISALDKGTLFAGASTTWNTTVLGASFTQASNAVYFRNRMSGTKYLIGTFQSDGKSILLPTTLMSDIYSCGNSCKGTLPVGDYDVTVMNQGGESDPVFLSVKAFSGSSTSGSLSAPVRQNATNALIGTLSFGASVPVYVKNISVSLREDGISSGAVGNLTFKDELTGKTISSFDSSVEIGENQSKIIGIYASVTTPYSGTVIGQATITIQDYVGTRPSSFVLPPFLTTVSGF